MTRRTWIGLFVLATSVAAVAQEVTDENQPTRRGIRERRSAAGANVSPKALADRLAPQLNLSAEQKTQFDALVEKHQADWDQRADSAEQRRELVQAAREAQENGDTAKADELRDKLQAMGPGRGGAVRQFMTELEPMLNETQRQTLETFRETVRQESPPGTERAGMRELVQNLPTQLNLTPEQKTQFDALLAEQRETMRSRRGELRETVRLRREAREALENGDTQKVRELEQQINERQANSPMTAFFDKLNGILDATQQAKLAELRAQWGGQRAGGPNAPGADATRLDARRVLAAAKRLQLKPEQREQLKEIERQAQLDNEAARTLDAKTEVANRVKDQIKAMLDATQADEFEQLLSRAGRAGRPQRDGAGQTNEERPQRENRRRNP